MTFEDFDIDVKRRTSGQIKTRCPKCGGKNDLSVNVAEGIWNCHKPSCAWVGTLNLKANKPKPIPEKEYVKPSWINSTSLNPKVVQWFASRGISQSTLVNMKITDGEEYMPQREKNVNVTKFNYFRDGELVNTKFRDGAKNFKLVSGAELIFYNLDAIKDKNEIVIVEGEMDALSFIEGGMENVVSVPNGAGKGVLKLDYLDNCISYFEGDKKIFIATDNDDAGLNLKNELARRLDVDRCFQVDFKDCKDANEYLLKYGKLQLEEVIKNAKPFPTKGVIFASQLKENYDALYEKGLQRGDVIGVDSLDVLISYEPSRLTVITGIPAHGKSYVLDFISTMLSTKSKWRFGIFSPEHHPIQLHLSRLAEKLIGKRFSGMYRMSHTEKDMALDYMNDNIFFVRPDDENFSLENILNAAKSLVLRYGINALIIDPYNRIDHHNKGGESETNYISSQLDMLTNFKQKYNIHIFLVAHPTKMKKSASPLKYDVPTLYDVAGSATFYSKADNGMSVYRDFDTGITTIYVQKVKYEHTGKEGFAEFTFNKSNGRFTELGKPDDNSNYLLKQNSLPIEGNPDIFHTASKDDNDLEVPF